MKYTAIAKHVLFEAAATALHYDDETLSYMAERELTDSQLMWLRKAMVKEYAKQYTRLVDKGVLMDGVPLSVE